MQDSIFDHRRSSPLVFDWFYSTHRTQFETLARRAAEEAVDKIRGKIAADGSVSTEEVGNAVSFLRRRGHEIGEAHPPLTAVGNELRIWVDGRSLSAPELLSLAAKEKGEIRGR